MIWNKNNIFLKKNCLWCVKNLKYKFDNLYDYLIEIDNAIKEWLKVKLKRNENSHMILMVFAMII
jgi:hypothetical protein